MYQKQCYSCNTIYHEVYKAAQSSAIAFKKWRMGGPRFQKASVLGRKRKAIQ